MMMSLPSSGANSSRMTTQSSKQKGIAIRIDTTTEGTNENSSVCLSNLILSFDLMGTAYFSSPSVQMGETKNEKNGKIDLKRNLFI